MHYVSVAVNKAISSSRFAYLTVLSFLSIEIENCKCKTKDHEKSDKIWENPWEEQYRIKVNYESGKKDIFNFHKYPPRYSHIHIKPPFWIQMFRWKRKEQSPTAPTADTTLLSSQTYSSCYQPTHIQSNWSNKALHYAISRPTGHQQQQLTWQSSVSKQRGNMFTGYCCDPGLQTWPRCFLYHADRGNNRIDGLFLCRYAYVQGSNISTSHFCIEQHVASKAGPLSKDQLHPWSISPMQTAH